MLQLSFHSTTLSKAIAEEGIYGVEIDSCHSAQAVMENLLFLYGMGDKIQVLSCKRRRYVMVFDFGAIAYGVDRICFLETIRIFTERMKTFEGDIERGDL